MCPQQEWDWKLISEVNTDKQIGSHQKTILIQVRTEQQCSAETFQFKSPYSEMWNFQHLQSE